MNKKIINSLIFNIIIFILVTLGTIFMITGYRFMSNTKVLASGGFESFKFYTVDSNLFVGVASFLLIIYEVLFLKGKIKEIPKYVYVIKYVGVVAVLLTFFVTLLYLAPSYGSNFLFLYQNSNLLFHLIVPILSFISFVFYEDINLEFKHTIYGISTMILYGIYYIINLLIHQENGMVEFKYDWYGFVKGGIEYIFIVFPIILIITYLISYITYKIKHKSR